MLQEDFTVETTRNYLFMLNEEEDFQLRFIDSNRTVVNTDCIYQQHTHVLYEIILMEQGKYRCMLDGCEIALEPWDLLLIQPNQKHKDFLFKGSSMFCFHFTLYFAENKSLFPAVFSSATSPGNQKIHISDISFFRFIIGQLMNRDTDNRKDIEYFRFDNALFSVFFQKLLSLYSSSLLHEYFTRKITLEREVSRLNSVFARHKTDMPELDQLCQETHMSRSSLYRTCRLLFNMSPRKACIHYKIMHIQNFIRENSNFSVKELSQMFGFKTQFHFSRVFHNETGIWPNFFIQQSKRMQ